MGIKYSLNWNFKYAEEYKKLQNKKIKIIYKIFVKLPMVGSSERKNYTK